MDGAARVVWEDGLMKRPLSRIVSGNLRVDVDAGHVLCFLVLRERLALPPDHSP